MQFLNIFTFSLYRCGTSFEVSNLFQIGKLFELVFQYIRLHKSGMGLYWLPAQMYVHPPTYPTTPTFKLKYRENFF